jgi:phage FluMu gp28-like protein
VKSFIKSERDVAKSLSHKVNKNVALNASSSDKVESSPKALKSRKKDSSDEGSADEEMALVLRNFKKFMKKKYYKKGGDDKKKPSQRKGQEEIQGEEQELQEEISRSCSCWSRVGV